MLAEKLAPPQTSSPPIAYGSKKGVLVYDIAGCILREGLKEWTVEQLIQDANPLPGSVEGLRRAVHSLSSKRVIGCSRADPVKLKETRTAWIRARIVPETGVLVNEKNLRFTWTRAQKGAEYVDIVKEHEREDHPLIIVDNNYEVALAALEAFGFYTEMNGVRTYLDFPSWIRFYGLNFVGSSLNQVRGLPLGIIQVNSWEEITAMEGW